MQWLKLLFASFEKLIAFQVNIQCWSIIFDLTSCGLILLGYEFLEYS